MYIIVVGAGTMGYYLAKTLVEEEHDAVVIDKSGDKCKEIANKTGVLAIRGDATEPDVLEHAGIKTADAVVAVTSSDETNIIVCLLAKNLGCKKVIARLGQSHYDEIVLKKLGIDLVFHPEATSAMYRSELITKPEVADLAFISRGAAEIIEVEVKEKNPWVGKKVGEISKDHPKNSSIIAIYEDNSLVIPEQDYEIKPGEKILILR